MAYGEEDVEQVRRALHLCQPVGVAKLRTESGLLERVEHGAHVLRTDEDVEVLAVAPDAGERVVRVRAPPSACRDGCTARDLEPPAEEAGLSRGQVELATAALPGRRKLEVAGAVIGSAVSAHKRVPQGPFHAPTHAGPSTVTGRRIWPGRRLVR
jgi:hypothetical protein